MKMFYAAVCFCFAGSLLAGGCISGLNRTDISELKKRDFSTIGISMELPVKPERLALADSTEFQKEQKYKLLTFSMHPVYPGGPVEPLYLINVRLIYFEKGEYANYQRKNEGDKCFNDTKFHESIIESEVIHPNGRTPLRCFRKDCKNEKTGDVVIAAITYMDNYEGNTEYRDKDVETIKQMLNSIKFIDGK